MTCNFQAQGETTFAQKLSETYRYSVTVADNRLCIWVEERSTKLQWSSNELTRGQYLTMENVIPGATIEDYAKHFEKCLCPQLDEGHSRTLTTEVGASFRLELAVKLHLFENVWPVVYVFKLLPSVEHRLAALEEQVRTLHRVVADQALAFLQVGASTKKDDLRLLWTGKTSEDFAIKDTKIEFRRPGLYHISAVLNYTRVENVME